MSSIEACSEVVDQGAVVTSRVFGIRSWRSEAWDRRIIALLCFAFPLVLRLYTLRSPVALNPDEAQWTVSARRILQDWVVWRSNDLTTSGPLNGLAVSWPYLFGATPSILTSRLTGLLLQSGALLAVASLLRPGQAFGPAGAALLVAALYLGLQTSPDFIHYSSELVSLVLLTGAASVLCGIVPGRPAPWRWMLCGAMIACLPLAKLQSVVLAVLLGAVCVVRLMAEARRFRASRVDLAALVVGAAVPMAALVLPPFLVGEGRAVIEGYVLLGAGYGGERTMALFEAAAFYIALMSALFACAVGSRSGLAATGARLDLLWLAFGLWPALFFTVWLPGRSFLHYCHYLIVGLPLAIALAERGLPPCRAERRWIPGVSAVAALAIAALPAQDLAAQAWAARERAEADESFTPLGEASARALYAWTGVKSGDGLLMWGWEPQLTAYAGLRSADRAAHAEYLIRPNRGRDYFRSRLLADLSKGLPALVLDTVRPGYFFENDPQFDRTGSGLDSFPGLDALVRDRYERVSGDAGCAALYLRRDLAPAWRSSEVELRSTAPRLVGGAMTEKCGEWWAPEPLEDPVASLSPVRAEPVSEVWILSSRGGPKRDRGTTSVRLTFVSPAGSRDERVVRLLDYPSWTVVRHVDGDPVARIDVEPLTFVGKGPAISAVKAFRVPAATSLPAVSRPL